MKRCVSIIQARLNSSRLPNKVLLPIGSNSVLGVIVNRLKKCKNLDDIIVATTKEKNDDKLVEACKKLDVKVYRGEDLNVLSRFCGAAKYSDADIIVRFTADSPLIDPDLVDESIKNFNENKFDYYSNVIKRTYPDGLDFEIFTLEALKKADKECKTDWGREHVTVYMRTGSDLPIKTGNFKVGHFCFKEDFSHLRWTIDTINDLEFFNELSNFDIENKSWLEIIQILTKNPDLLMWNRSHKKRKIAGSKDEKNFNNGFNKSVSHLNKSLKTIPIGSQTFSKSYMGWVLGKSPLYAQSAKAANIIDIDGNNFIDYIMGLMPVVLGYSDPFVDAAVVKQIKKGTSLSLSGEQEVELSEKLVKLIPCAEMVRYGKNGSDVTTAAIRLSRAYTGKDKIIVCGYHGWHDWYIGTTEKYFGVPKEVRELSLSFPFNDIDSLKNLISKNVDQIACLIIEPTGKVAPEIGFLDEVRNICTKHGILLIFDEVISGFRINLGGAQKEYSVTPDLACFGKAMANGYPISALVGKRKIMKKMEKIFFSTTFGGELSSIAAAIATIQKLEDLKVIEKIKFTGCRLKNDINNIINKLNLESTIQFSGEDWWPRIDLKDNRLDSKYLLALLRQEFSKNGLLIASSLNLCFSHTSDSVISESLDRIENSLKSFLIAVNSKDPKDYLEGELVFSDFNVRSKLRGFDYDN